MIDFEKDVMWHLDQYTDKLATIMLITIDNITIFGTLVYNEYLDIFESADEILDVSENQDYTVLSFVDSNNLEILIMSVPTKLGAAFLSNPEFYRANAQSIPNARTEEHKWGHVSLGFEFIDGDFVDLGIGGPMDLMGIDIGIGGPLD